MKAYCIEIYVPVITWVQVFAEDEDTAQEVVKRALDHGDPSVTQLVHDNVPDAMYDRSTCDTIIEVDTWELNPHIPTFESSHNGYQETDEERYNELYALVESNPKS